MSNNIYDILKKFNNLESVKNTLTEGKKVCKDCGEVKCKCIDESKGSKPDFLDMDKDGDKKEPMKKAAKEKSKGAIAEAVARVEQQLAEKYQGFKKLGEMGPTPLDKDAAVRAGAKAQPSDAATTAPRERERVVSPKIDKYEKAKADAEQTRRWVVDKESPNANNFGRKVGTKIAEPIAAIKSAWHGATDAWDHTMGNDTAPDPKPPVSVMSRSAANKAGIKEGEYNEDMLSPGQKKIARMSPPADEIDAGDLAKLRADKKGMKKEGNAFSGAMAKAKASGQDEFNVGGKEYKVQEGFPTVSDAQKRHKEQTGKTTHGTKVKTATGTRHERNYDHDDAGVDRATGEKRGRGRPKADRFA
jgi:hypothetical protein